MPLTREHVLDGGELDDRLPQADVFEDHLLPKDWRQNLDRAKSDELAVALAELGHTARQVLLAALDTSISREGVRRLGELVTA